MTKEAIASPLRAPFTRYTRSGVASEVLEEVVADSTHHPHHLLYSSLAERVESQPD